MDHKIARELVHFRTQLEASVGREMVLHGYVPNLFFQQNEWCCECVFRAQKAAPGTLMAMVGFEYIWSPSDGWICLVCAHPTDRLSSPPVDLRKATAQELAPYRQNLIAEYGATKLI